MKIDPSNLNHDDLSKLLLAFIMPRPIALVSTIGEDNVLNVAPFSFYNGVCAKPPTLCFSAAYRDGEKKDTLKNIEATGDFVVNAVSEDIAQKMNTTCGDYPSEVDEFEVSGLTPVKSELVRPPRVAEAPLSMECKLERILEFGEVPYGASLIFGEVVLFHARDELYSQRRIDLARLKALGRLAGNAYCRTADTFEMERPKYLKAT